MPHLDADGVLHTELTTLPAPLVLAKPLPVVAYCCDGECGEVDAYCEVLDVHATSCIEEGALEALAERVVEFWRTTEPRAARGQISAEEARRWQALLGYLARPSNSHHTTT